MDEEKKQLFARHLTQALRLVRAHAFNRASVDEAALRDGLTKLFEDIYSKAFNEGYCCGGNNASTS